MITYTITPHDGGHPLDGYTLFDSAWDECVELQCSDKYGWVSHTMRCISNTNRVEVAARIEGNVVGGLVLCADYDQHVGHCMSVLFHYVQPAYRNVGIARQLLKMALEETRRRGLPVLAYSHRICDWKYQIIYKKV